MKAKHMSGEDAWVAATTSAAQHVTDTSLNLLLIDPQGQSQLFLVQALTQSGCTVFTVGSTRDAWPLLRHTIDLILLETSLEHDSDIESSFELCQKLKQLPQTSRIPVIFVGEGQEKGDRLRAFEVGGVDFIQKPVCPEEVFARIKLHVSLRQTQQRIQQYARQRLPGRENLSLLTNLQKTLRQQAIHLREHNIHLQKEICERHQIEQALRQEQQKSEQLLLNILPEAIVCQLKQFQGSLAERFEEATVMFADIVDFTPLAAQRSPLELVNLLNQIFSAFDQLANKYQLEKIKTIGDAYMVVGGVPVDHENHTAAIANMALEMQTLIQTFERGENQSLQLRIGINVGMVVAGVIGIKKFSYDLWGDTVNVASRMESQGKPGKIQVTEATYNRLQTHFQFEPAQQVMVKGKGLMKTYYLVGRY
ncbi:adenylate/guanylate cyclase domain-containing protein [Oscillatoria sp. CS-180]|uniref:adenylate/guanylate cyclase domain-containing protein n=1 Tax=Oscillatoria sp. CS-180 TaxID=3021720 RepID=UPI002330C2C8|nr:adenylate/guanylate cyclase domain-containing protein [Oscillatoria sp. CS-180]MDB9528082.1 adenylate/guanylate cyclase domain-containing protein [Oscillatoria sp. CS-180]